MRQSVSFGSPEGPSPDKLFFVPATSRGREGIFYLCRFNSTGPWEVYVHTVNGRCELSHGEWWPDLLGELRRSHPRIRSVAAAPFEELQNAPYAFPRGRLVRLEKSNVIYWGGEPEVRARRSDIERAFHALGQCRWRLDEHERTLSEDRLIAARALSSSISARLKTVRRRVDKLA